MLPSLAGPTATDDKAIRRRGSWRDPSAAAKDEEEHRAGDPQSEIYNFHRLDLTIVTIYDEDGLRLATTAPVATPTKAFSEARKILDNKVEGSRK